MAPPRPPEVLTRLGIERIRRSLDFYQTFLAFMLVLAVLGGIAAHFTGTPAFLGVSPTTPAPFCASNGTFPPPPAASGGAPIVTGLTAISVVAGLGAVLFVVPALASWRRGVLELRSGVDPVGFTPSPPLNRALAKVEDAIWSLSLFGVFILVFGIALASVLSNAFLASCGTTTAVASTLAAYSALVALGAVVTTGFFFLANRFLLASLTRALSPFSTPQFGVDVERARAPVYLGSTLLILGVFSWVIPELGALAAIGYGLAILGFRRMAAASDGVVDRLPSLATSRH